MAFDHWDLINAANTVASIMTPSEELITWKLGEPKEKLFGPDGKLIFDVIPVLINGTINAVITSSDPNRIEPLTRDWLTSQDTPIPDLMKAFQASGKTSLLVIHRQDVVGIISQADLNKIPARTYLYNLIARYEVSLIKFLKKSGVAGRGEIIASLNENRLKNLLKMEQKLARENIDIDLAQMLYLSELHHLLLKKRGIMLQTWFFFA